MKNIIIFITLFCCIYSQDATFYMGAGIINADLKVKNTIDKHLENSFSKIPYFFIGYDVPISERSTYVFSMQIGGKYMVFENRFAGQEDRYNLMILNLVPKLDLKLSDELFFTLKGHTDLKVTEFFANRDGSSEKRSDVYLEDFNSFQIGVEAGISYTDDWMNGFRTEVSFAHFFTPFLDNSFYKVEPKPMFQLTIYTPL